MNDESPQEQTDLDAARRDVARAEARLSNRWRAAKVAGEKTMGRAMTLAKPVLIGTAVVGGVALLVSSLSRRRRGSVRRTSIPSGPSLLSEVARAAALALASTAARRLADRYLTAPLRAGGALSAPTKLESEAAR
jgi:hypothetical protein